jgi:ABC-type sugar transport system ATPase subunit
MRVEINKLHRRLGATMIFVTHDQVEAMTLADRIVVLRLGVVEQVGTPLELYNTPANLFVAGFIGSPRMNFLDGSVADLSDGAARIALAAGHEFTTRLHHAADSGAPVTIGIRPEDFQVVAPDAGLISGDVQIAEQLGGETFVYVALPGGSQVTVEIKGQADLRPGEALGLTFDPARFHLFGADDKVIPHG